MVTPNADTARRALDVAERLVQTLMDEFRIPGVRLKLTKPGAVPAARGGVGVEIERGCL